MSFLQTLWRGRKLFAHEILVLLVMLCTVALVVPPLAEASGLANSKQRKVIIQVDGKRQEVVTKHTKLHSVLHDAGVKVAHHDEVRSSTPHVTEGTVITVYRAKHMTLEAHGKTHKVISGMPTVGEVLEQHGYKLTEYSSNPNPETEVQEGMHIKVETLADHKQRLDEEAKRAASQNPGPNYVKTESGDLRFTEHFEMEATAYTPDDGGGSGMTAIGIPARYGVVAVDPDVIELGTRVYIPGYGIAIAADTGGAVNGMVIDVCMNSYDDCINFGCQDVDVYVLAN